MGLGPQEPFHFLGNSSRFELFLGNLQYPAQGIVVGAGAEPATATTIVDRIDRNDHRLGSATIASTATIIDCSIALTSNIIDGKGRNDHLSHRS